MSVSYTHLDVYKRQDLFLDSHIILPLANIIPHYILSRFGPIFYLEERFEFRIILNIMPTCRPPIVVYIFQAFVQHAPDCRPSILSISFCFPPLSLEIPLGSSDTL